jgi:uncharacterized membrane protein
MGKKKQDEEPNSKSNWRFGVYCNRDDPRWVVPDFGGLGLTINFAKFINLKGLGLLIVLVIVVVLAKHFW